LTKRYIWNKLILLGLNAFALPLEAGLVRQVEAPGVGMPLCQGFALASKNCRPTAFLIPTQQLKKEFPASLTARAWGDSSSVQSPALEKFGYPWGPPYAHVFRTNPKLYLAEEERLIIVNGKFGRTSSKYEAKMTNPKILRLIRSKKAEKAEPKTNPNSARKAKRKPCRISANSFRRRETNLNEPETNPKTNLRTRLDSIRPLGDDGQGKSDYGTLCSQNGFLIWVAKRDRHRAFSTLIGTNSCRSQLMIVW
jgi:hypothetical protein